MYVYIYIYMCVCVSACYVIWFNGISTLDGYLMPNSVHTQFLSEYFVGNFIFKHVFRVHLIEHNQMVSSVV